MQISGKGHDPTRPSHPSHPPRPSRFPSSHPPRARVIARYIAFRTNRYPVPTLYASPPSHSHIDKSAAEQISNLLLDRLLSSLLPPPSRQKPESSKRASSVSYQSSSGFTDRSLLPPFLTSFPSTDLPLPRVSPRDFSFLLPLLPSTA